MICRLRLSIFLPTTDYSLFCRARATNTQLGQEESSAFTYLEVYGEDGLDVPPEIIVAPKDTQIVKGTQVTELQVQLLICLASNNKCVCLETVLIITLIYSTMNVCLIYV